MKYYIYQHIRLDTNQVFYIGKGTKMTKGNVFRRAYSKNSRNEYWLRISKITSYKVEILEEFEFEEECLKRETELIKKHGFSWNNTGTLCNMVSSDEEIRILAREKSTLSNNKKVYQYSLEGEFIQSFDSVKIAKSFYKADIYNAASGRLRSAGDYQWRYEKFDKIPPYSEEDLIISKSKKVYQYSLDYELIKEWNGTRKPSEELNINRCAIRNCLSGIAKTTGGYIWSFSDSIEKPNTVPKYGVYKDDKLIFQSDKLIDCANYVNLSANVASVTMRRGHSYKGYKFKCHDNKSKFENQERLKK